MQLGDPLVPFKLPSTIDEQLDANQLVGKALALVFYLRDGSEDDAALLSGFRDCQDHFDALGINIVAVSVENTQSHKAFAEKLGLKFPLLSDAQLTLPKEFGLLKQAQVNDQVVLQMQRHTFLFDVSLRVIKTYANPPVHDHAQQVLADAQAWLYREEPRDIVEHAPVLLIPNVFPQKLCDELRQTWETENEDSGFMKQVEGKTVGMLDYSHKIRRDHFLAAGPLLQAVSHYVGQRVVPEMARVFNYAVTRREDFRIACYDATRGGYFRPHRDNTTGGTAHRRFAMSLLLNDDYEGGYLRFPEFGKHRYRPKAGGACIFSCSLLHEATDVTVGRRFVLLSFFYGEAEAKLREEYNKQTGGGYRA